MRRKRERIAFRKQSPYLSKQKQQEEEATEEEEEKNEEKLFMQAGSMLALAILREGEHHRVKRERERERERERRKKRQHRRISICRSKPLAAVSPDATAAGTLPNRKNLQSLWRKEEKGGGGSHVYSN